MTQLNELINTAKNTARLDWEEILGYESKPRYIDEDSNVTIIKKTMSSITGLTLSGEMNSQYINFIMDRYQDGIDLSTKDINICYKIVGTEFGDVIRPINVFKNIDQIEFGWVLPFEITKEKCEIEVGIYCVGTEYEKDYIWKSKVSKYAIEQGFSCGTIIPQPEDTDWFDRVIIDVNNIRQNTINNKENIDKLEKEKLNKQQGVENIGKVATVDENGNLVPKSIPNGEKISDYRDLYYKPLINGVELNGDKTERDLGLVTHSDILELDRKKANALTDFAKGNPIILNNAEDNLIKDSTFSGFTKQNPIRNLSGTVISADNVAEGQICPTKVESLNVMNPSEFKLRNGATFVNNELILNYDNSINPGYIIFLEQRIVVKKGEKYTFWLSDDFQKSLMFWVGDIAYSSKAGYSTVTISEDRTIVIQIQSSKSAHKFENAKLKFMVTKGEEQLPYTPYISDFSQSSLKVTGKNLFKQSLFQVGTSSNGVECISADSNTVVIKNTTVDAGGYMRFYDKTLKDYVPLAKVGKTYTLLGTTQSGQNYIRLNDASLTWVFGKSIEITQQMLDSNISLYGYKDKIGECKIQIMVVPTTSDASHIDFEPYKEPTIYTPNSDGTVDNVQSISPSMTMLASEGVTIDTILPEPIVNGNVDRVSCNGKNLFNSQNVLKGYLDSKKFIPNSKHLTAFARCPKNTVITCSKKEKTDNPRFRIAFTNDISDINNIQTSTVYAVDDEEFYTINSAEYTYILVWYYFTNSTPSVEDVNKGMQIELNSVATSYEPYKGFTKSFPNIELSKWDKIKKIDGVWKKEVNTAKKVFIGSGNEGFKTYVYENVFQIEPEPQKKYGYGLSYCDTFKFKAYAWGDSDNINCYSDHPSNSLFYFVFPKTVTDNISRDKFLKEHPTTIIYKTSSSTYEILPPETQEALNSLQTFAPNSVIQTNDGIEMDIEYIKNFTQVLDAKADKEYVDDNFANAIKGNAEGSVISIDDISPIEHTMDVKAESVNLTPYPFSSSTQTIRGITFTNNGDGSITVNGTNDGTDASNFYMFIRKYMEPNTDYYISDKNGLPNGVIFVSNPAGNSYPNGGVVHTRPDGYFGSFVLQVKKGVSVNNFTCYPMLNKGSSPLPYSPYISDFSNSKIYIGGSNFVNADELLKYEGNSKENDIYHLLTPQTSMVIPVIFNINYTKLSYDVKCDKNVNIGFKVNYKDGTQWSNRPTSNGEWKHYEVIIEKPVVSISVVYSTRGDGYLKNINLTVGENKYDVYKPIIEYIPNPDGTVDNVKSVYPHTTVICDDGITAKVTYNVDTNKVIKVDVDKKYVDDSISKAVSDIGQTFASAFRKRYDGTVVACDIVSPVEHVVGVNVESANIFDPNKIHTPAIITGTGLLLGEEGSYSFWTPVQNGDVFTYKQTVNTGIIRYGFFEAEPKLKDTSINGMTIIQPNIDTVIKVDSEKSKWLLITFYRSASEETVEDAINSIMLNKGSFALPYTPYISDVSKSRLQVMGGNLLNSDIWGLPFTNRGVTTKFENGSLNCSGSFTGDSSSPDYSAITNSAPNNIRTLNKKIICKISNPLPFDLLIYFRVGEYGAVQDNIGIEKGNLYGEKILKDNFGTIDLVADHIIKNSPFNVSFKLQIGYMDAEIEDYKESIIYPINPDGTVDNVKSISPNMTMLSDTNGVNITADINLDGIRYVDKRFDEIKKLINPTTSV